LTNNKNISQKHDGVKIIQDSKKSSSSNSIRKRRIWDNTFAEGRRKIIANPIYRFIDDIGTRLAQEHVYLLSAGISFNVLLCLIPMMLVALYVAGKVIKVDSVIQYVQQALATALPTTQSTNELIATVTSELRTIDEYSATAGYIGIGILIWTSSALFSSLRTGLNAIFNIPSPKFFLWYKFKDLLLTIATSVIILISTLITPLMSLFSSKVLNVLPSEYSWLGSNTIALVLSAASAYIVFFFLLRFVPNKPQPLFIVNTSAVTSVLLWESARFVFTWYLNNIATFGRFYGTFTVLVVSAIWIYYSTLILLVSAEIAEYIYQKRNSEL
jgi:membrane protein